MDIAGGVRLTYKIDFSKYKEIYTNEQEFVTVTRRAQDIILRNIDARISSLGVSDYNSYIQSLNDGSYVVVEIGGVSDLDEAKEIIGKTVELEFKLAYE
jgi:preprotein translocase subunit SecD